MSSEAKSSWRRHLRENSHLAAKIPVILVDLEGIITNTSKNSNVEPEDIIDQDFFKPGFLQFIRNAQNQGVQICGITNLYKKHEIDEAFFQNGVKLNAILCTQNSSTDIIGSALRQMNIHKDNHPNIAIVTISQQNKDIPAANIERLNVGSCKSVHLDATPISKDVFDHIYPIAEREFGIKFNRNITQGDFSAISSEEKEEKANNSQNSDTRRSHLKFDYNKLKETFKRKCLAIGN